VLESRERFARSNSYALLSQLVRVSTLLCDTLPRTTLYVFEPAYCRCILGDWATRHCVRAYAHVHHTQWTASSNPR
jgi:hypothetical protein